MIERPRRTAVLPILLIIVLSAGLWSTDSRAQLQSCEYPLFLQVGGVDANVLIIFDSSSSMNAAMYHPDYDPDTDYSGNFRNTGTYYVSRNGSYTPRDFGRSYPDSPSAYLVVSDLGESGQYEGNYMNWIYFHATDQQRSEIPRVTRIQVGKAAIADVIDRSSGIRFGIMIFNGSDGGTLVSPVGSEKGTLIDELNDIAGESYTPLAETMVDAMAYFKRKDSGAPIEAWCQKSFLIVITDGYPTRDRDVPGSIGDYDNDGNDPGTCSSVGAPYDNWMDCSDYMDDVALYLFDNDMRPDLDETKNNIITYTIGFNIDAGILQETADNGGGLYFNANNPAELARSLSEVMSSIVTKVSSGTAAAVVSTEDTADDRLFRAKFKPGSWHGYFESFTLPYHENDTPVWEAGSVLSNTNPDKRKIYTTADGTSKIEFKVSNLNALYPHMNIADPDAAESTIEYIRGNHVEGYRDRQGWMLGDVIDSSPVIVGAPSYFYEFLDYWEFKAGNEGRKTVIYVGANDGMLHCFDVATGEEMWAYIPNNQLGKLKTLTSHQYCHSFFVNGTPKVVDAHVGGSWKTILIGSEREGGNGYFALDVTDPTPSNVRLLWDISLPVVRESWGVPEVARVKSPDGFIGFVGSGPDIPTKEAHVVALNLENGSVAWSDLLSTTASINKATDPITVDIDYDDYDDLLYVGDLAGNMWRYDLRTASWSRTRLFKTDQPIQAKPVYTIDASNNVLLYFGTGQYILPVDIKDTQRQSFYCIIDNHSGLTVSTSSLVDQTNSINPIGTDDRGWFIDLTQAPGERVVETGIIAAGTVYFTSFQPDDAPCKGGGRSWLYYVDAFDGSSPDNDDDTENDTTDDRVEHIGDGISSEPVLYMEDEDIIIQDTDSDIIVKDVRGHLRRIIVRAWRQRYQ